MTVACCPSYQSAGSATGRDVPDLDLAAELWVIIYIHTPYARAYRQQVMVPFGGDQRFLVWGDRFEAMSFWFCRSTAARGRVIGVLATGLCALLPYVM